MRRDYVYFRFCNLEAALGINIGNRHSRDKGFGKIAIRVMLDYAFTVENLERVYAEVFAFNTRSHRCLTAVGFQQEGTLRKHELHNGQRTDVYFFGILVEEFYQRYDTLFRLPE